MAGMETLSWREERRRDSLAAAQIARDAETAREDRRLAAAEAASKLRRDEKQALRADRKTARKARAARWSGRVAWLREHVTALLFVPVIVVPGVLAWTAMAAYGTHLYGPPGVILPAFSEGGMWVFAGATTIRRHRHPGKPVWHLRLGTAVFAGYGAALNFAHGFTSGSLLAGAVMALVSVAGVVAHQLITAGPRRSRDDRAAARTERAISRRERIIRRAALKRATAVLDADGNARLVHVPGIVALTRSWGRTRLEAARTAPVWLPWPMTLPGSAEQGTALLADVQAVEAMAAYRGWHSAFIAAPSVPAAVRSQARPVPVLELPVARTVQPVLAHPEHATQDAAGTPPPRAKTGPADVRRSAPKPAAKKNRNGALSPAEKRAKAERLLRANPAMSRADLVEQSGVSVRTADRIMASAPRRLHIAQG